jgi:hypothetical protein
VKFGSRCADGIAPLAAWEVGQWGLYGVGENAKMDLGQISTPRASRAPDAKTVVRHPFEVKLDFIGALCGSVDEPKKMSDLEFSRV